MSASFLRDVRGVVTAAQLRETVDGLAEWQLPSGMVSDAAEAISQPALKALRLEQGAADLDL